MIIKRIIVFTGLFLFFICSSAMAMDTSGTFRVVDNKNVTQFSERVTFQEGETLYEVTRRTFNIGESEGHIISINGIESIPEQNIHWAAFINGQFVELGLDEVILSANDEVVWALKDWDEREILK